MTRSKAEKNALRAANFGFSALLLALFGWINLEVLVVSNSAGIRGHLLTLAFGASLSTIAYRRYQTWWTPLAPSIHGNASRASSRSRWAACGLLAGAGFLLAYAMRMDLITSVAVGAGTLTFVPWARSRFCREHFFVSHALLVAGGLPVLVINAKYQHPLVLLAETWFLWALAAGLLLSTLLPRKSVVAAAEQLHAEPKAYADNMQ